ncbi:hypothetical protein B566_EDAN011951 [Ephemera danica]|nr:hypothetical protein B566_EDAN011951 [Ephemera danica]
MSGGNNNTFRLGSRPQYAPPPGLGSSVSAIASLAASMAMSTPLPVPGSSPIHHDPPPMPTIVASAPGISSASELFRPQSATGGEPSAATYRPVYYHWFYKREIEGKPVWNPFSMSDSMELEKAFTSDDKTAVVATDGGRYDVHVSKRLREPVYWSQPANEVRRCSWFYRGALDSRSHPYEEAFAAKLEEEYRLAFISNRWPRRIEVSYGEAIVLNGPTAMMHLPPTSGSIMEDWGSIQEQGTKPRSVRRGCDEFEIDEGEQASPDHLLFLVHGIGSVCDLKFRSVVEVVDDFRSMALTLVRSHFRQAGDEGKVSRVEVLPVSWHGALHGEETGIDQQLQGITLKSIPRLRHFTNDTLLDILFYTSPVYCQTIIRTVGHELNRLQQLFMKRNPDFCGGISLGGHSLGSLILFDLLCHQKPLPKTRHASPPKDPLLFEGDEGEEEDELGEPMPPPRHLVRRESCRVDYMMGPAGTGQPSISYPQLHFNPSAFFALGSPVGMFVTVRGIESLGREFCLPTCPGFFNIFHPFDPVAYRVEALIDSELSKLRPVVIPHHKGRKRMHIELRETMTRVGADLKERLVDSVRSTWNTVYQLAMFNRGETLEQEVLAEQMLAQDAAMAEDAGLTDAYTDWGEPDTALMGKLNSGRRVDYVLQEAPLESFNEYLFALGSHVCYWESEDTMLLMLREIYSMLGVTPDKQFDRSREGSVARERSWSAGSPGSGTSPSQQRFLSAGRPTPPFSTPPSSVSKQ